MNEASVNNQPGDDEAARLLVLLRSMEPLKHLPRTGWVDRLVQQPETVAAHSWRLAVMAWLLAERLGLDAGRAACLSLVHDLPEVYTGDRTPFDDDAPTAEDRRALAANPPERAVWRSAERRARKVQAERQALHALLADAPPRAAAVLHEAWEEYEGGSSAEAILVRQLDKLEAYLQGWEYATSGRLAHPETLNSFRMENAVAVSDPALRSVLDALERWVGLSPRDALDPGLKPED